MLFIGKLNGQRGGLKIKKLKLSTRDREEWGLSTHNYATGGTDIGCLWYYDFFDFKENNTPKVVNFPLSIVLHKSDQSLYLGTAYSGQENTGAATIAGTTLTITNSPGTRVSVVARRFFTPIQIDNRRTILDSLESATSNTYTGTSYIGSLILTAKNNDKTYDEADSYLDYSKVGIKQFGYLSKVVGTVPSAQYKDLTLKNNRFYLLHIKKGSTNSSYTVLFAYNPKWFDSSGFKIYIGEEVVNNLDGLVISKDSVYIVSSGYTTDYTLYELPLEIDDIEIDNTRRNVYPNK